MTQATSIPTVTVTARVYRQDGQPVRGATVSMRLTTAERYGGYIVPRETSADTDASGVAVLRVWPNALGSEASEYRVKINVPDGSGARSIAGHAVVPNAACDLSDIMELPAYAQRGAGAVITAEVAGYAAQASAARDAGQAIYEAVDAVGQRLNLAADGAEADKRAALAAAQLATAKANEAASSAQQATATASAFETDVLSRVDGAVVQHTVAATRTLETARDNALKLLDTRIGQGSQHALGDIALSKTDAVNAVHTARTQGIAAFLAEGQAALTALRDDGDLFRADFDMLIDRAQTAARQAGCSASNASQSASIAMDIERRIKDSVKLFDSCLDIYNYAQDAEAAAASAVQDAKSAAANAAQTVQASTAALAAAAAANMDAQSANVAAAAASRDAQSAAADADKAGRIAATLDFSRLTAIVSYVEGVNSKIDAHILSTGAQIATLVLSSAKRGKLALVAATP